MKPYNDEELSKAVYYPACGTDFSPILAFSHISNLFIYVDWGCLRSHNSPKAVAGSLRRYCNELNKQLIPDSLELINDGKSVIFREIHPDKQPELPGGFELNDYERKRYKEVAATKRTFCRPWAQEFTICKTVGKHKSNLKLLYIIDEGIATYCTLFDSGKIAPKILVTVQSGGGLGGGFVTLEDPTGIMARFLYGCDKKPLLWVRGGMLGPNPGPLPENPGGGLYSIVIKHYKGWNKAVAAFARDKSNIKLFEDESNIIGDWTTREDFSKLLEICVS